MESTSNDLLVSVVLLIPECSTAEEMKLDLKILSHPFKLLQGKGIEKHALYVYLYQQCGRRTVHFT